MTALVADIQRASVHDGPGLRTTVFFKGCPLRCVWCHNPETISPKPETLLYPEKCIGCGRCNEGCYTGARVICGREMTASELIKIVCEDLPYYGETGGVTFSGGEPLMQAAFLREMLALTEARGIRCAIETSLYLYDEEILSRMQLVMADLKIWNDALHKSYTGVSNERIKENFRRLNALGVPIVARTPVICEIDQGVAEISAFLKELKNVRRYELLPYHPLGESKRLALGLDETRFTVPTKDYMKELQRYVFVR